ncbi:MAG TPA: YkgJ family cysteine cluster protein [Acidobacteriaceae bacterium]|nr:YkgJ family cysteine cluster protein [Acidobacteriaceae bacterium]
MSPHNAPLSSKDRQLVQIIDAASASAAHRSGPWLQCRLGCTQCCIGIFSITQLDAQRLRAGLDALASDAPARAAAVRRRAAESVERLTTNFPGNPATGQLDESNPRYEDFANDEPCPALDPATGACDLYAARPVTCRVFGPPIRSEDGIGVCELNFINAPTAEILAAELDTSWSPLESALNAEAEAEKHQSGSTTVAWALIKP